MVATAIVGGAIGGISQILSNVISGNHWSDGLAGAIAGGAVYNVITVLSGGNTILASYGAAFVESSINEIVEYASHKKALSVESVKDSIGKVSFDTIKNGSLYLMAGMGAEWKVPIDYKNWIKPSTFMACFCGNFAKKVWKQTVVQTVGTIGGQAFYNWACAV